MSPEYQQPLFALFTRLIADGTGCLARRLTGSLAFAAAAFFYGFLKFSGFHSLNMFHSLFASCSFSNDAT